MRTREAVCLTLLISTTLVLSNAEVSYDESCTVKKANILFVVDASGSISANDWQKSLSFVSSMVSDYDIGEDSVDVALIQFSSTARLEFGFGSYSSVQLLKDRIASINKVSGGTETASALQLALSVLSSKTLRKTVANLCFVITDGKSSSLRITSAAAAKLHKKGIYVFGIGVGNANDAELRAISSGSGNSFKYTDYSKLVQIQEKLLAQTCKGYCENPDGRDCSWYRNCLEKKFPCEGTDRAYAISFGETYCNRYGEYYEEFSAKGKQWVDNVRKCLQVRLASYIEKNSGDVSCEQIRDEAFRTHTPCYVDNKVCFIPGDWGKIVKVVYPAFIQWGVISDTFLGALQSIASCGGQYAKGAFSGIKFLFKRVGQGASNSVSKTVDFIRNKREITCDNNCTAWLVADQVADKAGWTNTSLHWIAYAEGANNTDGDVTVDIYLTDGSITDRLNTTKENVESLLNQLNSGEITIEVDGLSMSRVSVCEELECLKNSTEWSTALVARENANTASHLGKFGLLLVPIACYLNARKI